MPPVASGPLWLPIGPAVSKYRKSLDTCVCSLYKLVRFQTKGRRERQHLSHPVPVRVRIELRSKEPRDTTKRQHLSLHGPLGTLPPPSGNCCAHSRNIMHCLV